MKICIDGLGVSRLQGTGLYSYTYELLENLLNIYPQPDYELIWDAGSEHVANWLKYKNLSYRELSLNRRENRTVQLEDLIKDNKISLYHSPNNGFSIPGCKLCNYIMTVHDLMAVSHREYLDSKYSEKFMSVFPKAAVNCDKIIAVSHFIKKELVSHFQVSEDKIAVIYPGCSKSFTKMDKNHCWKILKNKYGIEDNFILYAGSIHIRKSLPLLFQAFKVVTENAKDLKLVIAGRCDGKRLNFYMELKRICIQLNIDDRVLFIGRVDYQDMPFLYNCALCAVNLSSYEGFPMTTIESMACGVPTICSRSSCFSEIAEDGALYASSEDEGELADLILRIIWDEKFRDDVVKMGVLQSKKYNWDNSIKKLVNLYESVVYGN